MPFYAIAAALLAASCWGGNYTATKIILHDMPPMLLLTVRFAIVSLLLAPIALRERPWPRMRDMAIISATLIIIQFGCMFTALHMGLSIASTIIASQMGAPFACLLSAMVNKDYLGPWRSFGLLVALFGVAMVAGTPNASEHWSAFLLAMLGALGWAVANIYTKRVTHLSVSTLQFWPALFAVLPLLALTLLTETAQLDHLAATRGQSWLALAYSVLISSLVGYGVWNWLVKRFPLSQVVPYTLFAPVVGISVGAWMFHDSITTQMLLGIALTIVGVGIISIRRPKLVEPELV